MNLTSQALGPKVQNQVLSLKPQGRAPSQKVQGQLTNLRNQATSLRAPSLALDLKSQDQPINLRRQVVRPEVQDRALSLKPQGRAPNQKVQDQATNLRAPSLALGLKSQDQPTNLRRLATRPEVQGRALSPKVQGQLTNLINQAISPKAPSQALDLKTHDQATSLRSQVRSPRVRGQAHDPKKDQLVNLRKQVTSPKAQDQVLNLNNQVHSLKAPSQMNLRGQILDQKARGQALSLRDQVTNQKKQAHSPKDPDKLLSLKNQAIDLKAPGQLLGLRTQNQAVSQRSQAVNQRSQAVNQKSQAHSLTDQALALKKDQLTSLKRRAVRPKVQDRMNLTSQTRGLKVLNQLPSLTDQAIGPKAPSQVLDLRTRDQAVSQTSQLLNPRAQNPAHALKEDQMVLDLAPDLAAARPQNLVPLAKLAHVLMNLGQHPLLEAALVGQDLDLRRQGDLAHAPKVVLVRTRVRMSLDQKRDLVALAQVLVLKAPIRLRAALVPKVLADLALALKRAPDPGLAQRVVLALAHGLVDQVQGQNPANVPKRDLDQVLVLEDLKQLLDLKEDLDLVLVQETVLVEKILNLRKDLAVVDRALDPEEGKALKARAPAGLELALGAALNQPRGLRVAPEQVLDLEMALGLALVQEELNQPIDLMKDLVGQDLALVPKLAPVRMRDRRAMNLHRVRMAVLTLNLKEALVGLTLALKVAPAQAPDLVLVQARALRDLAQDLVLVPKKDLNRAPVRGPLPAGRDRDPRVALGLAPVPKLSPGLAPGLMVDLVRVPQKRGSLSQPHAPSKAVDLALDLVQLAIDLRALVPLTLNLKGSLMARVVLKAVLKLDLKEDLADLVRVLKKPASQSQALVPRKELVALALRLKENLTAMARLLVLKADPAPVLRKLENLSQALAPHKELAVPGQVLVLRMALNQVKTKVKVAQALALDLKVARAILYPDLALAAPGQAPNLKVVPEDRGPTLALQKALVLRVALDLALPQKRDQDQDQPLRRGPMVLGQVLKVVALALALAALDQVVALKVVPVLALAPVPTEDQGLQAPGLEDKDQVRAPEAQAQGLGQALVQAVPDQVPVRTVALVVSLKRVQKVQGPALDQQRDPDLAPAPAHVPRAVLGQDQVQADLALVLAVAPRNLDRPLPTKVALADRDLGLVLKEETMALGLGHALEDLDRALLLMVARVDRDQDLSLALTRNLVAQDQGQEAQALALAQADLGRNLEEKKVKEMETGERDLVQARAAPDQAPALKEEMRRKEPGARDLALAQAKAIQV